MTIVDEDNDDEDNDDEDNDDGEEDGNTMLDSDGSGNLIKD